MKKTLLFSWLLCLLCITARAQSVLQAVSNQGETYKVEVYATKVGFLDSDKAAVTLKWPE